MADLPVPHFNFTRDPASSQFDLKSQDYLQRYSNSKYKYIATSAIVFESSAEPRVLLVQRAAHDSWPNHWETPGGGCDDEDESILHAVARELWEESGLVASYIGPSIGDIQMFTSSSGKEVGKFLFYLEVENGSETRMPEVKLDPNEHQAFVWATEDEVKVKQKGDLKLNFSNEVAYAAISKAFELHRAGRFTRT